MGGNEFKAKMVNYEGEILEVRELADRYSISHKLVLGRLRAGWSIEEAIGVTPRFRNKFRYPGRITRDALDVQYSGPKGTIPKKWRMR